MFMPRGMGYKGHMSSPDALVNLVRAGNFRAITRAISLVENRAPAARDLHAALFPHTGHACVIGITGAPGAGKSTFVDALAVALRDRGQKVAILAIDPTSPFSGGAVLGDRIRMQRVQEVPDIFMRSMATRGSLGGVSDAVFDAVQILDAAGMDIVLVETVGVGQAEVDIVRLSDTCLVLLVPGLGDGIQAMKAGLLEIADVFVVNKSDREGSDAVERDIRMMLSLREDQPGAWTPPICRTIATEGRGVDEVLTHLDAHRAWLQGNGTLDRKRNERIGAQILSMLHERVKVEVLERDPADFPALIAECRKGMRAPAEAAQLLLDRFVASARAERGAS